MLKIYENIKKRRLALGMTQEQLAKKMGYSDKGMISRIEKGQVDISYSKIVEFAEVLRTEPGELMGWDDDSYSAPVDYLSDDPALAELRALIEAATPEQKENLLAVAKALLRR